MSYSFSSGISRPQRNDQIRCLLPCSRIARRQWQARKQWVGPFVLSPPWPQQAIGCRSCFLGGHSNDTDSVSILHVVDLQMTYVTRNPARAGGRVVGGFIRIPGRWPHPVCGTLELGAQMGSMIA